MSGTRFSVEAQPVLPSTLHRLEELANDLYYSWDQQSRQLFIGLDGALWQRSLHNPVIFLRRIAQEKLDAAAADQDFLDAYHQALSRYDQYKAEKPDSRVATRFNPSIERVAFFCAEFGFHESLPLYSGGLGILAADYCKAASDLGIPFVAVGLLYRQGNLIQEIDSHGNQIIHYRSIDLDDLPIEAVKDAQGKDVEISIGLPERTLYIKVWRIRGGHIDLILLDTETDPNNETDRRITHHMYPSDVTIRLQQAMVLGIGGVKALDAMGLHPSIWHINEGLPALQLIERWRQLIADGLDFPSALELVAASTVFTTHTPVPAGHEVVDTSHIVHFLGDLIAELDINIEQFLGLGRTSQDHRFNFTSLCLRGTRFHNGVSEIHGRIASEIEKAVWPEIPVSESPLIHVTNGIHVPTFLAREWAEAFEDPDWQHQLLNPDYWARIDDIPAAHYWHIHQTLKHNLLEEVRISIRQQSARRGFSEAEIRQQLKRLDHAEDALILGFARRFATYKRATLLFNDIERLERLLSDQDRPVIIIMAGRAHQADIPGQDLIREVHRYAERPALRGKLILLEGYDLSLARSLVRGVDVWLNLPEYPFEACGTSGQKAGINGVLNLSVLDGWWPEGFNQENGWAIEPHTLVEDINERNRREAAEVMEILEERVVPMFFDSASGYSEEWISMSKNSMRTLIPQFNSQRMVMDYIEKLYEPSFHARRSLMENEKTGARELAEWKARVLDHWHAVRLRLIDQPPQAIKYDESISLRIGVRLGSLMPEDVIVECLVGTQSAGAFQQLACYRLDTATNGEETVFQTSFRPPLSGLQHYHIRVHPHHRLLAHSMELGLMKWL